MTINPTSVPLGDLGIDGNSINLLLGRKGKFDRDALEKVAIDHDCFVHDNHVRSMRALGAERSGNTLITRCRKPSFVDPATTGGLVRGGGPLLKRANRSESPSLMNLSCYMRFSTNSNPSKGRRGSPLHRMNRRHETLEPH